VSGFVFVAVSLIENHQSKQYNRSETLSHHSSPSTDTNLFAFESVKIARAFESVFECVTLLKVGMESWRQGEWERRSEDELTVNYQLLIFI
jgi:hypothetical protein